MNYYLSKTRRRQLLRLARNFAADFETPVRFSLAEVVAAMGIELIDYRFSSTRGASYRHDDGSWTIAIRPDLEGPERDFTIAHEIAHCLGIESHIEADSFAAEVLWDARYVAFHEAAKPGDDGSIRWNRIMGEVMELNALLPHLLDSRKVVTTAISSGFTGIAAIADSLVSR